MDPIKFCAHGSCLIALAIGPDFGGASITLDLAVWRLDFGPVIFLIVPLPTTL